MPRLRTRTQQRRAPAPPQSLDEVHNTQKERDRRNPHDFRIYKDPVRGLCEGMHALGKSPIAIGLNRPYKYFTEGHGRQLEDLHQVN